jgi:hypothetical protein
MQQLAGARHVAWRSAVCQPKWLCLSIFPAVLLAWDEYIEAFPVCTPGSYLAVISYLRQVYRGREIDRIPFSRSPTTALQRQFGDAERIPVIPLLVTCQLTNQPKLQSTTLEGFQHRCVARTHRSRYRVQIARQQPRRATVFKRLFPDTFARQCLCCT